jgi:hypothetical protein
MTGDALTFTLNPGMKHLVCFAGPGLSPVSDWGQHGAFK